MAQDDTSSTLIGYTAVLLEAIAERSAEETALVEKLTAATVAAASDGNDETLFGSLIVTLLFVPLSFYCGLVFFLFGVELYQFLTVWNLVSRTRTQNGVNLDITFGRRNQVSDRAHSQEKRSQQLQEKLFIREFRDSSESIWNDECTNNNCAICLSKLHDSDKVASIRDCSCCKRTSGNQSTGQHHNPHQFHAHCLTQWLEQSPSCPYCRDQLLPRLEKEKTFGRGTLQLSETLELASLEVEHYLFKALTIFGGIVASYTYYSDS